MTTIFVRYDAAGYAKSAWLYQDFIDKFFFQIQQSDQIARVIPHDSTSPAKMEYLDVSNLNPGDFLYVPILCKSLIYRKDFIEELDVIFKLKSGFPGVKMICPIGIEHLDTGILKDFSGYVEPIVNAMRLYANLSVLETVLQDPTQDLNRFVDASFVRVHNEAVYLNEKRTSSPVQRSPNPGNAQHAQFAFRPNPPISPTNNSTNLAQPGPAASHLPFPVPDVQIQQNASHFPFDPNYHLPNVEEKYLPTKVPVDNHEQDKENVIFIKRRKKFIVSQDGGGDFQRLDDAVRKVDEGSTIIVKPGTYDAPSSINKSLTIVGEVSINDVYAKKAEIIINGKSPIRCFPFTSDTKTVNSFIKFKNLIVKHNQDYFNDEVKGSCIHVEGCDFYLQECIVIGGSYCLYAGRGSSVRTLGGAFTKATKANIIVDGATRVELDKTQISSSEGDGVFVKWGAQPAITNCKIINNNSNGIIIHSQSGANIRDSKILRNGKCGVIVYIGAYCDISGSEISANKLYGVSLHFRCKGSVTDSILIGNKSGAKEVNGEKKVGDYQSSIFFWLRNKEKQS